MLKISHNNQQRGFTLLEILIALFIFTILSTLLVSALHNVIGIHARTEVHAERLHQLQRALLVLSRDVEQTVNRPILNAAGKDEPAFFGDKNKFTFTHDGFANPSGAARQSTLQRTSYYAQNDNLMRATWNVIDQAPRSKKNERKELSGVSDVHFEYLDKEGRFHPDWPLPTKKDQVLPRAVRVYLTIQDWGKMSQLYVIAAQ